MPCKVVYFIHHIFICYRIVTKNFHTFIEYEKAVNFYTEAMKICPKVAKKSLAVLFGNRAACYVKMVSKVC